MKKLVLLCVMAVGLAGFNQAGAQKIGYINTEELIGAMPEAQKANDALEELQNALNDQGTKLAQELQEKDSAFVADSLKMNNATKELAKKDLFQLYQKVQGWRDYMQDQLNQKQQALVAPIRAKALEAIKSVAKKNAYSYILDYTSVIVGPPGDDVLKLVKAELGIKETPATNPVNNPTKPPVKGN